MKYLDDVRVDLHYAMPLGEIVYDFFDAIKSRSRGYASYDYEFKQSHLIVPVRQKIQLLQILR